MISASRNQVEWLIFCFGAWLFPAHGAENHTVEIEGDWLE
jgi:hypothetical protein